MHQFNNQANNNIEQYFYDIITIIVSYFISYEITKNITFLYGKEFYVWILIVNVPIWVFTMNSLGMYDLTTFIYKDRLIRNILFSSFISQIFIAAMIFFIKETLFSRLFFACFSIISLSLLILERFLFTYFFNNKQRNIKKIIIVGDNNLSDKFIYYLKRTNLKLTIVKYFSIEQICKLDPFLRENVVDEIIFAVTKDYLNVVEEYVLSYEEMGITVRMVLELYDFKLARTYLTSIGTLPMLTFHTISLNRFQLTIKRSIDIIGGIVGLIITLLLCILIVPAIKIDSPGPVFFLQDRVGINGRIFKLYKFRTMTADADTIKNQLFSQNEVKGNLMFKIKDDPRITRIGKFLRTTSLDEFPQFINVLKGDMSLVGTRPPTVDEVSKYEKHHRRRISIKPGITGMWQVNGRSQITDFNKVVKLDTQYIDNWSVLLDIKILLQTLVVLFNRKGAM